MGDTGNRGAVFISNYNEIHDLIKVNLSKRGEIPFIIIDRGSMTKYNISVEEADKVVSDTLSAATLLHKK
eukprot:926309-Heterocapsa_arctica.AAC.1